MGTSCQGGREIMITITPDFITGFFVGILAIVVVLTLMMIGHSM